MKVKYLATLLVLFVGSGVTYGQDPAPQHFVVSTMAGSYGGNAVSVASTGVQLVQLPTTAVSVAYEFISNPNDSSKPRVGSGVVNVTKPLSSFLPASLKSKLSIDTTNYNLTFQGGAGVQSLSNGVGLPRTDHTVGNFAIYGSYPLPGGHVQVGVGYKWLVGGAGGTIKVPAGQLAFTF